MTFAEINWSQWTPRERAALTIIHRDDRILLIHKKRGLGAGKFNGPGGRLEAGETPRQAAIRETVEEIGVTPLGLREAGELCFQFVDGYSIHGTVFMASDYQGEPVETDEAVPHWFPCGQIPYYNMWADDRLWLPLALKGQYFVGHFLFDGDQMLGCQLSLPRA